MAQLAVRSTSANLNNDFKFSKFLFKEPFASLLLPLYLCIYLFLIATVLVGRSLCTWQSDEHH